MAPIVGPAPVPLRGWWAATASPCVPARALPIGKPTAADNGSATPMSRAPAMQGCNETLSHQQVLSPLGFRGPDGFGVGWGFSPERQFGARAGLIVGSRVWVYGHSIRP